MAGWWKQGTLKHSSKPMQLTTKKHVRLFVSAKHNVSKVKFPFNFSFFSPISMPSRAFDMSLCGLFSNIPPQIPIPILFPRPKRGNMRSRYQQQTPSLFRYCTLKALSSSAYLSVNSSPSIIPCR
jgi:hypothetical protein